MSTRSADDEVGPPGFSPLARDALLAEVRRRLFGIDAAAAPRIGRYRVRERIGRGGHGEVFAAFDPELQRDVAIKILHLGREVDASAWLVAEGRTLARLAHEHVVSVYDVGAFATDDAADGVFLVMELFALGSLDRAMARLDRCALVDALLAAGRGLAVAHAHGVVHCDFKPSNVLFGAGGRVAVADFGLARSLRGRDGLRLGGGTQGYMAPEQRGGGQAVDARADQYAYCVTWIEAMTGRRPCDDPHWRAALPPALALALGRGLSEQPHARFADMPALLDALTRAMRPPAARRRRVALAGLVAGTALLASAAASSSTASTCDVTPPEALDPLQRRAMATFADPMLTAARDRIDAFAEQWLAARGVVCGAPAATWRAHGHACLDEALAELDRRIDGLASPPSTEDARIALAGLPAPRRCTQPAALAADTAAREERGELRALESSVQLDQAHAMALAGRFDAAAALAEGALEAVSDRPAPRVRLAALRQLGAASHRTGQLERARSALEAAYFGARALGDDAASIEVAREAAIELVYLYGDTMGRPADALLWARHARALLRSDARGASWYLHDGIAIAELARGDLAAARAALTVALRDGRGHELAATHLLSCRLELAADALDAARRACAEARTALDDARDPRAIAELAALEATIALHDTSPTHGEAQR